MKTKVQDTSLEAYQDIKKTLGRRQKEVLSLFEYNNFAQLTNSEIAGYLGRPINTIVPRTNELVKAGMLSCKGKRVCSITARNVRVWGLKKRDEQHELLF